MGSGLISCPGFYRFFNKAQQNFLDLERSTLRLSNSLWFCEKDDSFLFDFVTILVGCKSFVSATKAGMK